MPKFCSECGVKLSDENMKFCSECGTPITSIATETEIKKPELIPDLVPKIESKPIGETSRLSSLKVEKFLIPNEIITYATRGSLYVGGEEGLRGYVTNNRVIFYASKGLIFKSDRLHEIPLKDIAKYKIVEMGIVFKKMHLELNELKIYGDRSDILDLYKAIQVAKHGAK